MVQFSRRPSYFFIFILLFCLVIPARQPLQAMQTADCLGTISLQLSRSVELSLKHVSEIIKALAGEYARIYDATPPMDKAEKEFWMKQAFAKGKTVSFRPFLSGPEPAYQALVPTYLFYNGRSITPNVTRELKTFVSLVPLFMVTVSYPVYNREKLIGVISRDITLRQLSRNLLKPITGRSGGLSSA